MSDVIHKSTIAALRARFVDLGGVPPMQELDIRMLKDASYTEEVMLAWCEPDSDVDLLFIVRELHNIFYETVTTRRYSLDYPSEFIASRRIEVMASGIDRSLKSVELVLYMSSLLVTVQEYGSSARDVPAFAALCRSYPVSAVAAMHSAGYSFTFIAEMAAAGMDAEMMLAAEMVPVLSFLP